MRVCVWIGFFVSVCAYADPRVVSLPSYQPSLYGRAGYALASGDVNGDGFWDLLVGEPGYDTRVGKKPSEAFGRVQLWLGRRDGTFGETPFWVYSPPLEGARAGFSVALGDVDKDGKADVLVGAPGVKGVQNQQGAVWVFWGDVAQLDARPSRTLQVPYARMLGAQLAWVGDLDTGSSSTGCPVLAVSAPGGGGKVYGYALTRATAGGCTRNGAWAQSFVFSEESQSGFGHALAVIDRYEHGGSHVSKGLVVGAPGEMLLPDEGSVFVYALPGGADPGHTSHQVRSLEYMDASCRGLGVSVSVLENTRLLLGCAHSSGFTYWDGFVIVYELASETFKRVYKGEPYAHAYVSAVLDSDVFIGAFGHVSRNGTLDGRLLHVDADLTKLRTYPSLVKSSQGFSLVSLGAGRFASGRPFASSQGLLQAGGVDIVSGACLGEGCGDVLVPSVVCNEADTDNDQVCNSFDNCLSTSNTNQQDTDGDGVGDACEEPVRVENLFVPLQQAADPYVLGASSDTHQPPLKSVSLVFQASVCGGTAELSLLREGRPTLTHTLDMECMCDPSVDTWRIQESEPSFLWDQSHDVWEIQVTPSSGATVLWGSATLVFEYVSGVTHRFCVVSHDTGGCDVQGVCNDVACGLWGENCVATPLEIDIQRSNLHVDTDHDGVLDIHDNCAYVFNPNQQDTDGDTVGDGCDNCFAKANAAQDDTDEDGAGDVCDTCPSVYNPYAVDTDGDGVGDVCDGDIDEDTRVNTQDNCLYVWNPFQEDIDGDGSGDVCDEDVDGDGVVNENDACAYVHGTSSSLCNTDDDADGVMDVFDNCPGVANVSQEDNDRDRMGDVCDADIDDDGVPNTQDNCVAVHNPGQEKEEGHPEGKACDPLMRVKEQHVQRGCVAVSMGWLWMGVAVWLLRKKKALWLCVLCVWGCTREVDFGREGRPCNADRACVDGYACVEGQCRGLKTVGLNQACADPKHCAGNAVCAQGVCRLGCKIPYGPSLDCLEGETCALVPDASLAVSAVCVPQSCTAEECALLGLECVRTSEHTSQCAQPCHVSCASGACRSDCTGEHTWCQPLGAGYPWVCMPKGEGVQGQFCDQQGMRCAEGHACVQALNGYWGACAAYCDIAAASSCANPSREVCVSMGGVGLCMPRLDGGFVAATGTCKTMCTHDSMCAEGFECETIKGVCRAKPLCVNHEQCEAEASGMTQSCVVNAECASVEQCVRIDGKGVCALKPIGTPSVCMMGFYPTLKPLYETGFQTVVCVAEGVACEQGVCKKGCGVDQQCASRVMGTSTPHCNGSKKCVCENDAECASAGAFSRCKQGACVCKTHAECAVFGLSLCNDGVCTCGSNTECLGRDAGNTCTRNPVCGCEKDTDCGTGKKCVVN